MTEAWTCNVRGGLGTQIISVMMAYAMAIENKETVDTLYFNYGNYFMVFI